jgi:hypothetical protein
MPRLWSVVVALWRSVALAVMFLLLPLYPMSLMLHLLLIPVPLPLFVVFDMLCEMLYCHVCFKLTMACGVWRVTCGV